MFAWIPGAREEGTVMLLRLVWMTSPAIGLWCVYALASVFVQPVENNAQPPRAIDPPEPFTVIVRTVPIIAADGSTFEDRWQVPPMVAKTDQPVQSCVSARGQLVIGKGVPLSRPNEFNGLEG